MSLQNRYGHGISFSQLDIVRVRQSIRWELIGNYVGLQLNCDNLGALLTIRMELHDTHKKQMVIWRGIIYNCLACQHRKSMTSRKARNYYF